MFYQAGKTSYQFPFDYIQKKFVCVKYLPANYTQLEIDNTKALTYGVDYTITDKQLLLKSAGDNTKIICIYRDTPTDSLVDFNDNSVLLAKNLNLYETQVMHCTEEVTDYLILHSRSINSTDDNQNIFITDTLPNKASNADIAIVRNTRCVYQYTNGTWNLIAAPKAEYLLDYETLIKRKETSRTGEANKISFANGEGKLPNNITGSPDKILNKIIDTSIVPTDGMFFVYRNGKFVLEKTIDDTKLSDTSTYSSNKIDSTFVHKTGDTINGNLNVTGNITGTVKGNSDTATKALQDNLGQQIDTTYVKNIETTDDTIMFTKGNGIETSLKVDNVKNAIHATDANSATKSLNDDKGQQIDSTYIKNLSVENATITISKGNDDTKDIVINNVEHAVKASQDTNGQQIDNTYIKDFDVNGSQITITWGDGRTSHYAVAGGEGGTVLDEYVRKIEGNNDILTITDPTGALSEIKINNVENSKKALQDTEGQQINKTYVKEITITNNVATIKKGDNTSSTATINNVAHATSADNAVTAQKVQQGIADGNSAKIVKATMAGTDYAWIRAGGSGDNGYFEIATSDNGSEPIYVRQYNGAEPNEKIARTATLLDASGNTSFPGKLTAATISGNNTNNRPISNMMFSNGSGLASDCNYTGFSGVWRTGNNTQTKNQPAEWGNLLHINGSGTNGAFQIWGGYDSGGVKIYVRRQFDQRGTWSNWHKFVLASDTIPWTQVSGKPDVATKADVQTAINNTAVKWTLLRDYKGSTLDKDTTNKYEGWTLTKSWKDFKTIVFIIKSGTNEDSNVNLATFPVNIMQAFMSASSVDNAPIGKYLRDGSPNWVEIGRVGTTNTFFRRLNSSGVVYQIWGLSR